MTKRVRSWLEHAAYRVWRFMIELPWLAMASVFRLLYGFQVEGKEHLPHRGPFILAIHEHSMIGMFVSGYIGIRVLNEMIDRGLPSIMSYMQEQLFSLGLFRKLRQRKAREKFGALLPHSAGNLALSLLDGYHTLKEGGIVILNPEGDLPWDGRPLPIGGALAWLGLHSGAPIVPALCSPGAYDIWPRWQLLPSLRGRLTLKIGPPIVVAGVPRECCTETDVAAAAAHIRAEFDRFHFGAEGIAAWMGPPTRDGQPLTQPLPVASGMRTQAGLAPSRNRAPGPVYGRGIAQLLWRCPVCQAEDTLRHTRAGLGKPFLLCQSCGTQWEVRRQVARDFRLKVVSGPQEIVGVEMGLSAWYDEMKRGFTPSPKPINGLELLPGEEVYLHAADVKVLPHRPNALFDGWSQREAPQAQLRGKPTLAAWDSIGAGRLLLTNQRLLWQNPERELDFHWSATTAVYLWLQNTLGIRYGTAPYRFALSQEPGLKWLTYAGTLARQAAAQGGHKLTTSSF